MKFRSLTSFWISAFCFALLFGILSAAFAEEDKDLSLEDIAKTEAAKLYISRQYQKSLEAFQVLETEHPKNVIIKRYVASLFETLRQFDQAETKLREAITLNDSDFVSHQMLGEIYIKEAKFDLAKQEFSLIKEKTPESNLGKYADQKISLIDSMLAAQSTAGRKQMLIPEFMKSEGAQKFAKGEFQAAITDFDQLLLTYPDDILIRRFKGIALTRLSKVDEAVTVYNEALVIDPNNVATRYYLAQAYMQKGKMDEAKKELRWIIEHDESSYKLRAQQALFQTLGGKAGAQKPWTFNANTGYDYDTNATYKSSDRAFMTPGDQNSGKYSTVLSGTYRVYQKGRWTITPDAFFADTIYNDFPNLNTYTPGGGVSALYGTSIWNKPAFINVRDGMMTTLLKNKFYVTTNTLSESLIYLPSKRNRLTLTHRFNYSLYNSDGTSAELTSRDGFSNVGAISDNYYFNDARNFYVSGGYDFEHHDTKGVNFIKNVHIARLGFHFPMVYKVEGDLSYVFKDSNYNQYASAPPKRRDDVNTLTATLSRDLTPHWSLSASYTYEDSRARNQAYEYSRQDFGTKLSLKY